MVLVYPEMSLKGQLPYRDFESITAPGNSMILARSLCRLRYEFFLSNGSDEPNQIVRENFELW